MLNSEKLQPILDKLKTVRYVLLFVLLAVLVGVIFICWEGDLRIKEMLLTFFGVVAVFAFILEPVYKYFYMLEFRKDVLSGLKIDSVSGGASAPESAESATADAAYSLSYSRRVKLDTDDLQDLTLAFKLATRESDNWHTSEVKDEFTFNYNDLICSFCEFTLTEHEKDGRDKYSKTVRHGIKLDVPMSKPLGCRLVVISKDAPYENDNYELALCKLESTELPESLRSCHLMSDNPKCVEAIFKSNPRYFVFIGDVVKIISEELYFNAFTLHITDEVMCAILYTGGQYFDVSLLKSLNRADIERDYKHVVAMIDLCCRCLRLQS